MTVDNQTIEAILNNYNSFTKEEFEILETYKQKKYAVFEKNKADQIANTPPKYFQQVVLVKKFGNLALEHKKEVLNSIMEHMNIHKEILLQCLAILQNLVNNPNLLDTLANLINSDWYGGQDFKEYICGIINNELDNINNLYQDLRLITMQPVICFLPELFHSQEQHIDVVDLNDFYQTLNQYYVIEP